ncbi:hypothetical protein [Halobacterium salinarum]|uniref:hypothetical protein n=1 Tax=Halobacterium salinarum TaxID=2242 RepID=UPI002554ACCB|nr:hypothetical protein [Halobacterium salinarum]MDL0121720.1 hypothetical protein [Halobacterium salinarum]
MDKGIAYIATGEDYIKEAVYSGQSCKSQNPELDITLLTDEKVNFNCFDSVIVRPELNHKYGIIPDDFFPYDHTLFLDTDTRVCGDLSEIFNLLDVYDIGVSESIGNLKDTMANHRTIEESVPLSFPLFNSGVILYKDNKAIADLFSLWQNLYTKYRHHDGFHMNQPTFRVALYQSGVQLVPLSKLYNCRVSVS